MNFASLAKKLTQKSNHHQHHHAAVITKGGAVVAVGWNKGTTHAEAHALRGLKDLKHLTLYSFRFTKGGKFAMAKPCRACEARLMGIKVYYTDENGTLSRL